MSICNVQTQQRGPVMTVVFTFMRPDEDYSEVVTGHINVNDLVLITGILKPRKTHKDLQLLIGSKKSEVASSFTVSMKISCGETVRNFLCQDEWAQVPILFRGYNNICYVSNARVYLYTIIVNITIHATIPVAPATCKQLYEDTEFTDFKLLATDGAVAVHKCVLFIHGEMFRTMLRGQWKETAEDSINMEGVTVQTLQQLKDFMYLGTLPEEGLEQLLVVARRCLMDNLVAACIDKLVTTVKPETFDSFVELACQHNIPELMRRLVLEIPDNIVNEIQSLNSKELKKALR